MKIISGETLENRGTIDNRGGTVLHRDDQIARQVLTEQPLVEYPLDLTDFRVWDAVDSPLPDTPANDDLGLDTGTFGVDAPIIKTEDAKAATKTQRGRIFYTLRPEYVAGHDVQVRLLAGMLTTVSDGTATIDVECYSQDADGDLSAADLCETPAQAINNLIAANKDFVITPADLTPGMTLDIRVTIAITDGATGTAVIGELLRGAVRADIRG